MKISQIFHKVFHYLSFRVHLKVMLVRAQSKHSDSKCQVGMKLDSPNEEVGRKE